MRRQPLPLIGDIKGLDVSLDPLLIPNLAFPEMNCVRFEKGIIRKDLGFDKFGENLPLDSRIMYFDQYFKTGGAAYTVAVTLDYLYKYNPSSKEWDKINSADAFTGGEDHQFCSGIMNDLFIITNGKDQVKKWDGSTWADLGGLTNKQAKYLHPFYNHLILGFTTEEGTTCPYRIRWSDTGDPETWGSGNAGFFDLNDTADWITGLVPMTGRLYVFKERSIWELYYVGTPKIFTYDLIVDGIGCGAPSTITSLGDEILFFGSDNIYTFDGREVKPLGNRIRNLLYHTTEGVVNLNKVNRSPSVYVEELGEYWLVFPTGGEDPDLWVKLALEGEVWTKRKKAVTALGFHSVPETNTWNDLGGDWTNQTWVWGEKKIRAGAPTTLIGDKDGYIYEDDRATKSDETFILETKDFMLAQATRVVGFKLLARGGPFKVSYSSDGGSSWSNAITFNQASDWKEFLYKVNRTVRRIRFKIETNAQDLDIKWMEPWFISRKRSMEAVIS